jgi:spoIIIJ-associated protein
VELDEAKEFMAETRDEAVEKARRHFGVSEAQLNLRFLPESLKVSGVGTGVVLLASLKDEAPSELGPVGQFADQLIKKMQLAGRVRIEEAAQDDKIAIVLRGESLEQKARQDARLAGAISHLVHRAAQKILGDGVSVRVQVGTFSGDDEEETGELEKLAREAAEEVRRSGEPTVLRPMNSKERWVIHNVITSLEGLTSESVGEGRSKRVKITPA